MIFVAVGTQFPFNRLIEYMDAWAAEHGQEVIAQISDGDYIPKNMKWERFLDGEQYNQNIAEASVFVSHAGMGNIISAREQQTPIIVMNRQFKLGEHRNDHQADGLKWMDKLDGVYAASTQEELNQQLSNIKASNFSEMVCSSTTVGNQNLSNYIADLINE
ncbi:MAG: glycosyltransferase [Cocleimonas sp.]